MSLQEISRVNNYNLYIKYSPLIPSDWSVIPTNVEQALNELATEVSIPTTVFVSPPLSGDGEFATPISLTGIVSITNGGTGQSTATDAFNALNPMTTTGDIIYESAPGVSSRLGIGTSGQNLSVVGGIPTWSTPASATIVTSAPLSGDGSAGTPATIASSTQNLFLATPDGISGVPSLRAIVPADIPTLNQNTTGTASNITDTSNSTLTTLSSLSLPLSQTTGTLGETRGGTNQTSYTTGDMLYANTTNTLSKRAIGTSGQVLQVSGGLPTWQTIPSIGTNYSGTVSTTNNTFTTVITIPTTSNVFYFVNASILFSNSSDITTSGAILQQSSVYNNAGTVAQSGNSITLKTNATTGYDVQILISGTNILIQVKGNASLNVDWYANATVVSNVP